MLIRLALLIAILVPCSSSAMPEASAFRKIREGRAVTISGCMVSGIKDSVRISVTLKNKKPEISLPARYKRQGLAVGTARSRYAACGTSDKDPARTVLFLKRTADAAAATESVLKLSKFRKLGSLAGACKSVRAWPSQFIYKTIGSSHFHDVRRNTIGLIMKYGASFPRTGCIDVVAQNGAKVGDLGYYSSGGGWYARYYGGWGCGDVINGNGLAARARATAGSSTVYMRLGTVCYGPVDASRCVGSKQC